MQDRIGPSALCAVFLSLLAGMIQAEALAHDNHKAFDALDSLNAELPPPIPHLPPPTKSPTQRLELALEELVSDGLALEWDREGESIRLRLGGGGLFASGSDQLPGLARESLQQVARLLHEVQEYEAELVGHCDSRGPELFNLELSERRAQAAAQELQRQGISENRLRATGRGEASPIAPNNTVAGRSRNRRVEILLSPLAPGSKLR